MNDLVPQDNLLVHPVTREVKELSELDHAEIRDGLEQLVELAALVRDAQSQLSREAWRRKNKGEKIAGVDVGQTRTWSVGDTASALDRLIADGEIPEDCRKFVYPVESNKADARSLNALADSLVAQGKLEAASKLLSARKDSVRAKVK